MPTTRSSARQGPASSPPSSEKTSGTKRKADASSPTSATKSKRGRPSKADKEKKQKTLEETMPEADGDEEMKDEAEGTAEEQDKVVEENAGEPSESAAPQATNGAEDEEKSEKKAEPESTSNGETKEVQKDEPEPASNDETKGVEKAEPEESGKDETKDNEGGNDSEEKREDPDQELKKSRGGYGLNTLDQVKADENDPGKTSKTGDSKETNGDAPNGEQTKGDATKGDAVEEDKARGEAVPSSILEKGVIYFFTRGRVGIEDPNSPQDLQRSYFVLRPLPLDAKITDGTMPDLENCRLLALPKKIWPKSGADRFMTFVEKAGASMATLKEEFFQGSEYSTKTTGTSQQQPVTPVGEGVYALTHTGGGRGTTHLAYMLTIPSELGEVQQDVGLKEKGSFALSLKNPESKGPAYASLPQGPAWPKEFIEEFSGLGWMPPQTKHLDYPNAQLLLIGEHIESAEVTEPKDERDDKKETPAEELEKLEEEDEQRVEHLKGDDTIFADLHISSKDYPKVMTTW